jgi:hypothetical protein
MIAQTAAITGRMEASDSKMTVYPRKARRESLMRTAGYSTCRASKTMLLFHRESRANRLILRRLSGAGRSIPADKMIEMLSNHVFLRMAKAVEWPCRCHLSVNLALFRGESATSWRWIEPGRGVLVYRPKGLV